MEDYTYDYINGTDIYLYQHKKMFRINTDTALLAQFMKVKKGERVLDIGTNNGALLLAAPLCSVISVRHRYPAGGHSGCGKEYGAAPYNECGAHGTGYMRCRFGKGGCYCL